MRYIDFSIVICYHINVQIRYTGVMNLKWIKQT
jgi:hypothetical protein